jgi:hypothetical protein
MLSLPTSTLANRTKAIVSLQAILWLLPLVQVDGLSDRIAESGATAPDFDTCQSHQSHSIAPGDAMAITFSADGWF